jgi:hypothetical protein
MTGFVRLFKNISNIKLLLIIMLLSVVLRLGVDYVISHQERLKYLTEWADDWDYINYSKAIFNGVFLHTQFNTAESKKYYIDEVPPVYPIILSVFYGIVGYDHLKWISFLNILITLVTLYFLYLTGNFMFKGRLSLLPPFLWAIYLNSLVFNWHALKEPFIALFLVLNVYFISRALTNFKYKDVVSLAILNAVFAHMDERYLFMSVLSLVFLLIILKRQNKSHDIIKTTLLFVIISIALFTPWMIRNYQRYDKIVLISPRTTVITDKIFGYKTTDNSLLDLTSRVTPQQVDSIFKGYKLATVDTFSQKNILSAHKQGLTPYQYNLGQKLYYNTVSFWQMFSLRPFMVGTGFKFNSQWGIKYSLIIAFQFSLFLILSLYAFWQGIRKRNIILLFILSILVINTIQHAVLGAGLNRYRTVMDPLIYLAACYTINQFLMRKQTAKQSLV